MRGFDIFPYFWLAMVTFIGIGNVAFWINGIRVGSARFSWMSSRSNRHDEPFEFWMAVVGKFLGGVVAAFLFYMGVVDMLHW